MTASEDGGDPSSQLDHRRLARGEVILQHPALWEAAKLRPGWLTQEELEDIASVRQVRRESQSGEHGRT